MPTPLTPEKMAEIGGYLLKGLTEKEACIYTDTSYSDFLDKKEKVEDVRIFFEKKQIEFKLIHIEQIQKSKSDKNSMYLLEKLRPDEFGSKKGNEAPITNIISLIIKSIQNDNSQGILIKNRSQFPRGPEEEFPVIKEVSTALN